MRAVIATLVGVCVLAFGAFTGIASAATVAKVANGLDNPRGLAFLPSGMLAVAEAGHGGDVCLKDGHCFGTSGQISTINIATRSHKPLVSGLLSALDSDGSALGIGALSVQRGRLLAIMGLYPQLLSGETCDGQQGDCSHVVATARAQAGQVLKIGASGSRQTIAGVGAFDYQWIADHHSTYGGEIDANPYGLLARPGGIYVADAGSNTLGWVANDGSISTLDHFADPNPALKFPGDAVPTCIATSSKGRLYVGDLAGRIWAVKGGSATVVSGQSGRHYTGCAADKSGNVYFASLFAGVFPSSGTGSIVKLSAGGKVSAVVTKPLNFPNGITVSPTGVLYVTVNSVCGATAGGSCGPLTGSVVKITLRSIRPPPTPARPRSARTRR
jgi:hypothetical protein